MFFKNDKIRSEAIRGVKTNYSSSKKNIDRQEKQSLKTKGDRLSISKDTLEILNLSSEIRMEKVNEIKSMIERGEYIVDAKAVAFAMAEKLPKDFFDK